MRNADMLKLEKELQEDLRDAPDAVLNRVRELVKEFLLEDATRLTGKRARTEQDIRDLIHMHARVALMKRVIESPHQFSAKDLKELFRDTAPVAELDKRVDPMALIGSLEGVSGQQKADLIRALADTARQQIRAIGEHSGTKR